MVRDKKKRKPQRSGSEQQCSTVGVQRDRKREPEAESSSDGDPARAEGRERTIAKVTATEGEIAEDVIYSSDSVTRQVLMMTPVARRPVENAIEQNGNWIKKILIPQCSTAPCRPHGTIVAAIDHRLLVPSQLLPQVLRHRQYYLQPSGSS